MKLSLLLLLGVEAKRRLRKNRDCFDLDTADDLNAYAGLDIKFLIVNLCVVSSVKINKLIHT